MKRHKLLIIQDTLAGGGAEKVLIDILRHFDYTKFEVTLLLVNKTGIYLDSLPKQVKLLCINDHTTSNFPILKKRPFYNRYTKTIIDSLIVRKKIGWKKFDTIISFIEGWPLYYHSLITSLGEKNITWVHIDLKRLHYTSSIFPRFSDELQAYKRINNIVFVSKNAEKSFNEVFNFNYKPTIIYNLIDREQIISKSEIDCDIIKSHSITLCSVGRLSEQKRYDRLLHTIAILSHKYHLDIESWIIGEGELRQPLCDLAKKLKIESLVRFVGFKTNPYPYIKKADAFIMTSDTEGFPLVIGEALCLGKPIIATNVTGPSEMLADGAGILTDLNAEAIAKSIVTLFKSPDLLNSVKVQALKRSRLFCVEQTMGQIYHLIQDC